MSTPWQKTKSKSKSPIHPHYICKCGNFKGYYAKTCMKCRDYTSKNNPNYGNGYKLAGEKGYWYGKKGKLHPRYTGLMDKKYYCKICKNKISRFSVNYGQGTCLSCAAKNRSRKNFPKGKIGGPLSGYYRNIWMRSSFEIKFAQFLDCSGYKWVYEPKRFYFKEHRYLPDFYLPEFDCYIEIKGWFRDTDKKKYKEFLRAYPEINIKMFFQKDLEMIGVL